MTCNDVNVQAGLLIMLCVAIAIAAALSGDGLLAAWLLARRRMSSVWLIVPVVTLPAAAFCVWLITDIWALLAGLAAGTAGGKGVCEVFWGQQQLLVLLAIVAIVMTVALAVRARRYHPSR